MSSKHCTQATSSMQLKVFKIIIGIQLFTGKQNIAWQETEDFGNFFETSAFFDSRILLGKKNFKVRSTHVMKLTYCRK